MSDLKSRGVRVLPGGDYGAFITNPMGTNAKDLELFVEMFGFTPMEAIVAATRWGGELMCLGDRLGQIRSGYLADLLFVAGDPSRNIRILQNPEMLAGIMIGGRFVKQLPQASPTVH